MAGQKRQRHYSLREVAVFWIQPVIAYFVSATLLQPVTAPMRGVFGPGNERLERKYQTLRELVAPLLSDDPAERSAALGRLPAEYWIETINYHEYLRFRRLAAFLRQREADDNVGYSILVYHVSADELARAVAGPAVELGRDILGELCLNSGDAALPEPRVYRTCDAPTRAPRVQRRMSRSDGWPAIPVRPR